MDRRTALALMAAGGLGCAIESRRKLCQCGEKVEKASLPDEKKRPNIIFEFADDWSWPHAGAYGDKVVKTPVFDKIAREGILFRQAFCAAPTCTASRGSVLSGQAPHRLGPGANLHSTLPTDIPVYPDLLQQEGYFIGSWGKGWAPGDFSEWEDNPAGPRFKNFGEFLQQVPEGRPFCFWFGSVNPHRPYKKDSGVESGMSLQDVQVPAFLPDNETVRGDILDYYVEVQQFNEQVAGVLEQLEKSGQADNTLVVMSSDNGMPFPRAKTTLYDSGTHMPLAIRWPGVIEPGRESDELVSLTDLAPTFLQAAGLEPSQEMTGLSMMDILLDSPHPRRKAIYTERERHTPCREGTKGYPMRAIRTDDYLYIENFRPERWPAGFPKGAEGKNPLADIDRSPTKALYEEHIDLHGTVYDAYSIEVDNNSMDYYIALACGKKPRQELFDLRSDPDQLNNLAEDSAYRAVKEEMASALHGWMLETEDQRATVDDDRWDEYPYLGRKQKK